MLPATHRSSWWSQLAALTFMPVSRTCSARADWLACGCAAVARLLTYTVPPADGLVPAR